MPSASPQETCLRVPVESAALATLFILAVASNLAHADPAMQNAEEPPRIDYPLSVVGPELPPAPEVDQAELRGSIRRGVEFLLDTQAEKGYWGRSANSKYYRIWAPVPGAHDAFRTATTALSIEALCQVRELFQGDFRQQIEAALDEGQHWLLSKGGTLRRSEPDDAADYFGYALYNVWGHGFSLHALQQLHQRAAGNRELQSRLLDGIEYHVDRLRRDEFLNGGWGYYDHDNTDRPRLARFQRPTGSPSSFTTATVLVALNDVKPLGFDLPQATIDRAMASLCRQRNPNFSYHYGEYLSSRPMYGINRPAGSLGRSQVCNLAMRLQGDADVSDEVLKTWLRRLIARNGWLAMSRKRHIPGQSPHFADFGVAGYFYYYGHYYAAKCLLQLPREQRPYFQDHLAKLIMPKQEKDGSWWDYILYDYHQQYGTAMALFTLRQCVQSD